MNNPEGSDPGNSKILVFANSKTLGSLHITGTDSKPTFLACSGVVFDKLQMCECVTWGVNMCKLSIKECRMPSGSSPTTSTTMSASQRTFAFPAQQQHPKRRVKQRFEERQRPPPHGPPKHQFGFQSGRMFYALKFAQS